MSPRTWDWHYQQVWAGINRRDGKSVFFVKYCPGADVLRPIPATWNGEVEVTLHDGWYAIGIPGAYELHCEAGSLRLGEELFGGLLTAPNKQGQPGAFTLNSLTLQRLPPTA